MSRKHSSQSTYHSLHGHQYDWNAYLMAPPGTRSVLYLDPDSRSSWDPRGIDTWYCGPSFDHYRCCKFYIPKTNVYRTSGSFDLFPQHCILPQFTPTQHVERVGEELVESIQALPRTKKKKWLRKIAKAIRDTFLLVYITVRDHLGILVLNYEYMSYDNTQ